MARINEVNKNTKIFAYFGLPKDATDKVPAVVLVHGGGGHAFHCWVKQWNDRGYAAIAMDTTGFMPKNINAGYKEGDGENWTRELEGVFFEDGYVAAPDNDRMDIKDENFRGHWMFHAVCSAILSHNFLRSREEIDTEKIGVMGISWGGVITSVLIGVDNRFAFAVPTYGSAYLAESYANIMQNFKKDETRKFWLAESCYDTIDMPVLWLAWNEDTAFSVNSNSKSYLHSSKKNKECRISFVNNMGHGHGCAWEREEPFFFADGFTKNGAKFPQIIDKSKDENVCLEIYADEGTTIKSASLYYVTSKVNCAPVNWNSVCLDLCGNIAKGIKPEEAVGVYKEIVFTHDGIEMTVTTEYLEL